MLWSSCGDFCSRILILWSRFMITNEAMTFKVCWQFPLHMTGNDKSLIFIVMTCRRMNLIVHITVMTTIKLVSAIMNMNHPQFLISWDSCALEMSDTAVSFDAQSMSRYSFRWCFYFNKNRYVSCAPNMHLFCTDKDACANNCEVFMKN